MKLWEEISETGLHKTNPILVSPCVKPAFNWSDLLTFCFLVRVLLSKAKSVSWAMKVLLGPCGRDSVEAVSPGVEQLYTNKGQYLAKVKEKHQSEGSI